MPAKHAVTYQSYRNKMKKDLKEGSDKKGGVSKMGARKNARASGGVSEGERRKARFHPGTVAVREVKFYQKTTDLLVSKAPLERFVRNKMKEIENDYFKSFGSMEGIRLSGYCLEIIAEAVQSYIIGLMIDANHVAANSKRETVMGRDVLLAHRIRGHLTRIC